MDSIERWTPLSGIVAVALMVIGALMWTTPDLSNEDEWAIYYNDSGNRAQVIVAALLFALAAFAFLEFFWVLSARLAQRESGALRLSTLMLAFGIVFTVALGALAAAIGSVPGGNEFGEAGIPSAELMIQLENLGVGFMLIVGGFAAAGLVAASSLASLRSGALPKWLGLTGLAVSVILLFSFMFVPILLFLIWVLVVSVVLLRPAESELSTGASSTA